MNACSPVLVTAVVPDAAARALDHAGLAHEVRADLSRAELLEAVAGRSAIIATLSEIIDGELLDAAGKSLRVVANFAVGTNNIDLEAATTRRVAITNTPDVLTEATADIAWALLMAVARRVGEGERLLRAGEFHGWTPTMLLGADLAEKTLGIVGAGRIGQATARRSLGWKMRVLYTARTAKPEFECGVGAERVDLDALLAGSDIVSVHTPLTPETTRLFDTDRFAAMKPGSFFINTARGAIHDEAALAAALQRGHLGGGGSRCFRAGTGSSPRPPGRAELCPAAAHRQRDRSDTRPDGRDVCGERGRCPAG